MCSKLLLGMCLCLCLCLCVLGMCGAFCGVVDVEKPLGRAASRWAESGVAETLPNAVGVERASPLLRKGRIKKGACRRQRGTSGTCKIECSEGAAAVVVRYVGCFALWNWIPCCSRLQEDGRT